jgi:NAD(P)-dependent dehydrogenase (short-subunit alcohol dehydrogenase family)
MSPQIEKELGNVAPRRGIGWEIAVRFAAEGGIPVIADLDLAAAEATVKEIKSKGSDAFAVAMNVVDEAAVEKGVADTMAKLAASTSWSATPAFRSSGRSSTSRFPTGRSCCRFIWTARFSPPRPA